MNIMRVVIAENNMRVFNETVDFIHLMLAWLWDAVSAVNRSCESMREWVSTRLDAMDTEISRVSGSYWRLHRRYFRDRRDTMRRLASVESRLAALEVDELFM